MEKTIRSYINTLIVLLIFYYATRGIVKLTWNHKDTAVVKARTQFLFGVIFIGSLVYIILIYHIVGGKYSIVSFCYKVYIVLGFAYTAIGLFYDVFSNARSNLKKHAKGIR
jgi:hypothetical protein